MSWGILLWPLRTLLRIVRDVDGLLSTVAGRVFKSNYHIGGACKQRGACCKNLGIWMRPESASSPIVLALVKWWYEFVYHFTCKGLDESGHVMMFSCRYLKHNKCSIHWRRPFICRNYPMVRYFDRPVMLPGCGYFVQDPRQSS